MSRYPIWWEDTITVYNKYTDPQTQVVTWFRKVLTHCFWKYEHEKLNVGQTVLESNRTICRIPIDAKFLERYKWEQQFNDMMNEYFTLSQGDIIVKGEVTEEIDEYSKGHRSTDFVAKYKALQGCIEIETVAINTKRGTNNKHYLVSGN
jgi:hypothetical protein